jgi:hypothetical protein
MAMVYVSRLRRSSSAAIDLSKPSSAAANLSKPPLKMSDKKLTSFQHQMT